MRGGLKIQPPEEAVKTKVQVPAPMARRKMADSDANAALLDSPSARVSRPGHLLTIEEVPAWYDANEFILTGYRAASHSVIKSLTSWGYLHNESCNIYSHLIPAVSTILGKGFFYSYLRAQYPEATSWDISMFLFHLLTVEVCMVASVTYHTLNNHSGPVADLSLTCDYVGIVTLILGDFISGLYFGFYCEPTLQITYCVAVRHFPTPGTGRVGDLGRIQN